MHKLILISFFLNTASLLGCSCSCFYLDVPLEEMDLSLEKFHSAKTVKIFSGILKDYRVVEQEGIFMLKFDILEYFKGDSTASQIEIATYTGDCGFRAPKNGECLIFAAIDPQNTQRYLTLSHECMRSVSLDFNSKKYEQYLRFLKIIKYKPNGDYQFNRLFDEYSCRTYPQSLDSIFFKFRIKDHLLDGEWIIYSPEGFIHENGNYSKGLRHGKWVTKTNSSIKTYFYRKGLLLKSKFSISEIDLDSYDSEEYTSISTIYINDKEKYKILRTYSLKTNKLIRKKKVRVPQNPQSDHKKRF